MKPAKPAQLSLLDMLDPPSSPQDEPAAPGPTVTLPGGSETFLDLYGRLPGPEPRDALVLQIRRDRATLREDEWGTDPGRSFYEARIEACTKELNR